MLTKLDSRIGQREPIQLRLNNYFDDRVPHSMRSKIRHILRSITDITYYGINMLVYNQFREDARNAN